MEQGFTNWWRLGPTMKNLFAYIFVYLIFAHYFYLLMNIFYLSHNFHCAFVYVSTAWLLCRCLSLFCSFWNSTSRFRFLRCMITSSILKLRPFFPISTIMVSFGLTADHDVQSDVTSWRDFMVSVLISPPKPLPKI